jgi:capsular exopolysaccharide synthesis family protein
MEERKKLEGSDESGTTLRDVFTVIFRHKLVNIIVFIMVMTTVYIGVKLRTPSYMASVKILVSGQMQKDVEVQRALGMGSLTGTQMALVVSKPIIERTVKALNLHKRPFDYEKRYASKLKKIFIDHRTKQFNRSLEAMTLKQQEAFLFNTAVGDLSGKIGINPHGESSLFFISVTDYSPQAAATIANVLSRSYVIFDIEQQIAALQLTYGEKNATIIKLANYIEKLEESLDGRILPAIEAIGPASVKIVAQAEWGARIRLRPNKTVALVLAFIMSIAGGVLLSFGFEYFDQTFKSAQDIERFLKKPFLGSIPERRFKKQVLIKNTNTATKHSQSFQNLSNKIYLLMKNKNLKSLILSDAEGSKETAIVTANLGLYLSYTGCSVLIIDANLRNSSMNDIFNVPESPGLRDVIEGKVALEGALQDIGVNMNILTTGETTLNPAEQLNSSAISDIMQKVKELYDVVLISCQDIKNFTDAVILSSIADGFILVVNEGKVKRQIIKHAIAPLEQENVDIVGAIIANRRYVIPEIIYKLT